MSKTNKPSKVPEKHLHFAVLATDIVVFRFHNDELQALLIDVYSNSTFAGKKAFPGGLIRPQETADQSVHRLLEDKGGLSPPGNAFFPANVEFEYTSMRSA